VVDQSFNTYSFYSKNKSTSWLIGPRVGLDTSWSIGSGFRIFGDVASSLFYQKIKTYISSENDAASFTDGQSETTVTATKYQVKNTKDQITPKFDCTLGFGYGTYFSDNAWHFDITAGYDFSFIANQNTMRYVNDKIFNLPYQFDIGDLMLHGLTISARLDF
jgi:hypothetical protein